MLSSLGRIVFALLRFAVGAGLALIGLGLLRQDPRVPAGIVHLATQPPFGGLWWALVALAGGVALMLHALPSPWRTDRLADRGGSADAGAPEPEPEPEPEPAPVARRSFDLAAAPPQRWHPPEWDPPAAPMPVPELQPVAAASAPPAAPVPATVAPAAPSPAEPVAASPVPQTVEAGPAPVFRSRPAPRRPSRARMIGPITP